MTTPIGEYAVGAREGRRVSVARTTRETDVTVTLGLDGAGHTSIATGIGSADILLMAVATSSTPLWSLCVISIV